MKEGWIWIGEDEQKRERWHLFPHLIRGLQNPTNPQLLMVGRDLLKEDILSVFFHSAYLFSNPISYPFLIPETVDAATIDKCRQEVK